MLLHEQLCLFDTPILEALFVLAVYKCIRAPSRVMQGLITAVLCCMICDLCHTSNYATGGDAS